MICEKCGSLMNHYYDDLTEGWTCPTRMGINVTSNMQESKLDDIKYEIYLIPGNEPSMDNIKLLSKITGYNYLAAKKMLTCTEPTLIYHTSCEAATVRTTAQIAKHVTDLLKDAGISYTITPDLPDKY